jgi:leader peptidase (prepilin peptidase)/N-methyltransferase
MNTSALFLGVQPWHWHLFFTVLSFTWGACIGSYLNVCIYRIPRELSTHKPSRSFCPSCKTQIKWFHNIPILSYILLRGRCAYCGKHFTARYAVVELLTAILFTLVWFKFDITPGYRPLGLVPITSWALIPIYWLMICGLILGTFVDFEHFIIPDRVTIGGIVAGIGLSLAVPALHGETSILKSFLASAVGFTMGFGILWLVSVFGKMLFKKDAMGFGDVKLLGAIGAFLGWRAVFFNIILSSFAGSIVGITLILLKKREMGSRIPYGPYIALAALLWILWGPTWWYAYINMLMPPLQ